MSIALTAVILFAVFFLLLAISVPVSVSIVIASVVTGLSSLNWEQLGTVNK